MHDRYPRGTSSSTDEAAVSIQKTDLDQRTTLLSACALEVSKNMIDQWRMPTANIPSEISFDGIPVVKPPKVACRSETECSDMALSFTSFNNEHLEVIPHHYPSTDDTATVDALRDSTATAAGTSGWNKYFGALARFKKKYGHTDVPAHMRDLNKWLLEQLTLMKYQGDGLPVPPGSKRRLKKLHALLFEVSTTVDDFDASFLQFFAKGPFTATLPDEHVNRQLWIRRQQALFQKQVDGDDMNAKFQAYFRWQLLLNFGVNLGEKENSSGTV
jgi:hypothetical protein